MIQGCEVVCFQVTDADMPDFSGCFEPYEVPPGFLERRARVRPVDLVKIDIVCAQSFQAGFKFQGDVFRLVVVADAASAIELEAEFRGDDDFFADTSNRSTQQHFRVAEPIGRRRVEEIDAKINRRSDRGFGLVVLNKAPVFAADLPAAQSDRRHGEISIWEGKVFHRMTVLSVSARVSSPKPLPQFLKDFDFGTLQQDCEREIHGGTGGNGQEEPDDQAAGF